MLGTVLLGCPELELSDDEATRLARAVANVAQYYDMVGMTPKMIAWVGLISVTGKVMGPKVVLAWGNHKSRPGKPELVKAKPGETAQAQAQAQAQAKQSPVFVAPSELFGISGVHDE